MSKKKVCKNCGGTGRCYLCNGRKCMACDYTGECQACAKRIQVMVFGSLALLVVLVGTAVLLGL